LVLLDRAEAEDVAAEAFARLWSHWGRIRGEDHAGGYVFKTAMRLCSKRRHRASREVLGEVPERGAATGDPEARRDVVAALAELPLRQRQSVVLRDWAGFETAEVARMLGTRESTVRVHLARGRGALRAALSVEENER
jgi:RNA polymerase sigma factor (sigma-70 family)